MKKTYKTCDKNVKVFLSRWMFNRVKTGMLGVARNWSRICLVFYFTLWNKMGVLSHEFIISFVKETISYTG
jgi:hypothetical protein